MPSKHPTNQYQDWFKKMMSATDPMIIFVDPDSEWPPDFSWADFVIVSLPAQRLVYTILLAASHPSFCVCAGETSACSHSCCPASIQQHYDGHQIQ
jgi:hypothetical protein